MRAGGGQGGAGEGAGKAAKTRLISSWDNSVDDRAKIQDRKSRLGGGGAWF